ncbi:MAG TPA: outer membrane protein transport protein [Parachlamydiaceae bacterium]|nr:outer membrane protein transport protein [Parachlamydiaceae bacterium]
MKLRFFNLIACISSLTALCLHTSDAEAIFASVKSTGMAATSISYPLDSMAAAYNPAGIASVGDRFDVEIGWVHNTGHAILKGNRAPVPAGVFVNGRYNGMENKCVYPAALGICKTWNLNCDWAIAGGLIIYNRNYQKTTYSRVIPLFGTSKPGLEYVNQTISPVIAVKWRDTHTIAISANCQLERLKVNGLQRFDVITRSESPGHVTNRGYGYSNGWGFTVGYFGQLTDRLMVGATYQPQTHMRRIQKYRGFLADNGKFDIPQKIGAGIAYRILPCVVLAFDVEHINWKPVRAFGNKFPNEERLGGKNGSGFGFKNQMFYRVGAEWQIDDCWTVRLGFRHANTPVRRSQTAVNALSLDTVESFLTAGTTWAFNACNEVSLVAAYGFEKTIHGKGSIPAAFGGGEADIHEQKFAIALAWGKKF